MSEQAGIARFEPRPPPSTDAGVTDPVVWAVAESHLVNFLTPRDCPRITFRVAAQTSDEDRMRFVVSDQPVVAFEASWLPRLEACTLHIYEMPDATFQEALPQAGYWISRKAVTPLAVEPRGDLLHALAAAGAEVRVLQDFWPLYDAVIASTMDYSILRKRNAAPRRA